MAITVVTTAQKDLASQSTRELPSVETWDEAVQVAIDLEANRSANTFALGDLANAVVQLEWADPELAQKTRTLKAFAMECRVGYARLKEAARVARQIDKRLRDEYSELTFTHWRVIVRADVAPEVLDDVAKKACEEAWTAEALADWLKDEAGKDTAEAAWLRLRKWLTRSDKELQKIQATQAIVDTMLRRQPEDLEAEFKTLLTVVERITTALEKPTKLSGKRRVTPDLSTSESTT